MKLVVNNWYWVNWVDVAQDSNGDPANANIAYRRLPLRYIRSAHRQVEKVKMTIHIFASLDEERVDDHAQVGWWAFPAPYIISIKPLKGGLHEK